jgi:glucose/arabinose dehydrogenase
MAWRHLAVLILITVLPSTAAAQLQTTIVAEGLINPVAFVADPSDPAAFYIVEQRGTIRTMRDGIVAPAFALDLRGDIASGGERGLLGLAFAPGRDPRGHPVPRRLYVNFTNRDGHTVIARFTLRDEGSIDPASRFDLMWPDGRRFIEQPFSNHNGGHLAFGPDSYLYVGLGDGGSGGDPMNHAQDPRSLLGKMLRLDVSVPDTDRRGYRVPGDNPFIDREPIAALPEIWAFGLRNPWRFSFDDWTRGGTGALVIADVGQSAHEEVNWEPRGAGGRNYGWRIREGRHAFDARLEAAYHPLAEPIHEYPRRDGQSITGGCVYRGAALDPMFNGRYFFADFAAGRVFSIGLALDARQEAVTVDLLDLTGMLGGSDALGLLSSFGTDADGEMYLVSYSHGRVLKIVPNP